MSPGTACPDRYHELDETDQDEEKSLLLQSLPPSRFLRLLEPNALPITLTLQAFILVVFIAILISLLRLVHLFHNSQTSTRYPLTELRQDPCGQTPEAARAAGCTFDLGSASWLPEECFDAELNAEFMAQGPWKFYHNTSDFVCGEDCGTFPAPEQLVPLADLDAISEYLDYLVWADRRYHVSHCMYAWKLMHKQMQKGRKMDQVLLEWHHTEHCVDAMNRTFMSPEIPINRVMTAVAIQFPNC